MNIAVIILAAGQGNRMRSVLPKVLHTLGGKSMLEHVLDSSLDTLSGNTGLSFMTKLVSLCVVTGYEAEKVNRAIREYSVTRILQKEQMGTGHAVKEAFPACKDADIVLVLYGDVPLIRPETLRKLIETSQGENLSLLTAMVEKPTGYGRIVRKQDHAIQSIVEEKDASPEQKKIREINTGIMAIPGKYLGKWLQMLGNKNAQGEYYLTDIVAMAVEQGVEVNGIRVESPWEIYGVNSREQLARLERHYQRQQAALLMNSGASLADPERLDVRGNLSVGRDVMIDINCIFEGNVSLGDNVQVGAGCVIRNSTVEADTVIHPYSIIDESHVSGFCQVGPYSRLRPGTKLAPSAKVGNFVEIKQSDIGSRSKINHMSYVGNTEVGENVNIGAGTITCNYDGANKHKTTIGDNAFIGSNNSLVAPVTVGADSTTGAGSTITREVKAGELAVARAHQKAITDWKRPTKKE